MKRIDKLARKLYNEVLQEYNAQGDGADRKSLSEMLDEKLSGYNKATKKIIESKVFDAVGGENVFKSLPPEVLSGVELSKRLYKNAKKVSRESLEVLNQGIKAKEPIREVSKKLYDGYDFRDKEVIDATKKLPKYLQRELKRGKVSDELVKYVDKIKTKPYKTALNQIVKKMDGVNKVGLEKALKVALEEKSRYYAKRIADTESHRARNLARAKEYMQDDEIEFVKFQISSRHPMTDICDYYARLDVGYGAGVVPKEQMVTLPLHPHCHCSYQPYYQPVKKRHIKNPQTYTMEQFSFKDQQRIAGSFDKLRQFKTGTPLEKVFNSVRPQYPIRKYSEVFRYNSGMDLKQLLNEVKSRKKHTKNRVKVGILSSETINFLKNKDVAIHSNEIYINAKSLSHMIRKSKQDRGAGLSDRDILSIPDILNSPVAVYFDEAKEKLNLLYCAESSCKKVIKIVVDTKYTRKKEKITLIKTAGYVEWANMKGYTLIIGAESR